MLSQIINKINTNKNIIIPASIVLTAIIIGLILGGAEIKTLCFFILLEIAVLAVGWLTAYIVSRIDAIRYYLYNSMSNFILGLHICAGMLVLGVYFTI